MKLLPGVFNDSFDDFFKDPFFTRNSESMKTDIREKDGQYLLEIELPGYQKEDISLALKDGCLNISATRNNSHEETDEKGNLLRQERFSGTCTRSFYVGENLREEDIHAGFENGELLVSFPKEAPKKVEEARYISIE